MQITFITNLALILPLVATAAHNVGDACSKSESGNAVCTDEKAFLKCTRKTGSWTWTEGFACHEGESCKQKENVIDIVYCFTKPTTGNIVNGGNQNPVVVNDGMAEGAVTVNVGANVALQSADITNSIKNGMAASGTDRGQMVQTVLDGLTNVANGKYSVLIFNLQQQFSWTPQLDPTNIAMGQFKFQGIVYKYWIFSSKTTFVNKGDGGWINWGFSGYLKRNENIVEFQPL